MTSLASLFASLSFSLIGCAAYYSKGLLFSPAMWCCAILELVAVGLVALEQLRHRTRSTMLAVAMAGMTASLLCLSIATRSPMLLQIVLTVLTALISQMYIVSATRKIFSINFRSGQILRDLLLFGVTQGLAGNREFGWWSGLQPLLERVTLRPVPAVLSWAAIVAELAVGLMILVPLVPITLLVVSSLLIHSMFAALAPRRIVPFSVSCVAMVAVASSGALHV